MGLVWKAVSTSFDLLHAGQCIILCSVVILTAYRTTNADGRCIDLLPPVGSPEAQQEETDLITGQTYKIIFRTKEYFQKTERDSFYPWVEVSPLVCRRVSLTTLTDIFHNRVS